MSYSAAPSFIAGGNISPSRFVKGEAGTSNTILQCVADDRAIGISHESTLEAPIPSASAFGATDGLTVQVYGLGEVCEVLGAATIAAFDFLKPDANGSAVVAGPGDAYSAIALVDAVSGDKVKVVIREGVVTIPGTISAVQQALSGAGAIDPAIGFTVVTTTGANALTLANGTQVGQTKEILLTVDGGDGTLTPTSLSGGTTITFSAVGDYVELVWNGTAWVVVKRFNTATGAITTPVVA